MKGDRAEALRLEYEQMCASYHGISDFRAKLLALLPLATGTGVFLLLERTNDPESTALLGPIGLFGVVTTLGLFAYELRGIQRCHSLELQAAEVEKQLGLSRGIAQFRGQPQRAWNNMLGPPAAGLTIYIAVVFAWLYVAGVGYGWWKAFPAWGLLFGYLALEVLAWSMMRQFLAGEIPTPWARIKRLFPFTGEGVLRARGWEHTALTVNDLRQATDFYRKAFGYEIVSDEFGMTEDIQSLSGMDSVECDLAHLRSPISKHVLELIAFRNVPHEHADESPAKPGSGHVSFFVDNLDEALDALKSLGGSAVGRKTGFDNDCRAYWRDATGTLVELVERHNHVTRRRRQRGRVKSA